MNVIGEITSSNKHWFRTGLDGMTLACVLRTGAAVHRLNDLRKNLGKNIRIFKQKGNAFPIENTSVLRGS